MSKHITQAIGSKRIRFKKILELKKQSVDSYNNAKSFSDFHYNLGITNACEFGLTKEHSKIICELIEYKKELLELECLDEELYCYEIAFIKGYLFGLESVLKINRQIFNSDNSFVLFIYTYMSDCSDIIECAFRTTTDYELFDISCIKGKQYCITDNFDLLCNNLSILPGDVEYSVLVGYNKKCIPPVEMMKKLSEFGTENLFLFDLKKLGEEPTNVHNLIDIIESYSVVD